MFAKPKEIEYVPALRPKGIGWKHPAGALEKAVAVLSLITLLVTNRFAGLLGMQSGIIEGVHSSFSSQVFLTMYLINFLFAVAAWKRAYVLFTRNKLLWALIALAFLSISWTGLPSLTFRRCVGLLLTTIYGVYLGDRYNLEEILNLLALSLGVIIVINIIFVWLFPHVGVHGLAHRGAWRGVQSHKNGLGQLMAFSFVLYAILAFHKTDKRNVLWLGVFASLFFLFKSRSTTAVFVLFFLLCFTPFIIAIRWDRSLGKAFCLLGFVVIAVISLIVVDYIGDILGLFGKDVSLTGRTHMWEKGFSSLLVKRPVLGYGLGVFWVSSGNIMLPAWTVYSPKALGLHNGYLELATQLGLVGFGIFAMLFIRDSIRAIQLASRTTDIGNVWPISFLIVFFMYNVTENLILVQNNFLWLLFIINSVYLSNQQALRKEDKRNISPLRPDGGDTPCNNPVWIRTDAL